MSSILKALKKLDDEKSARHPDELNIDSEILRTDSSPRISPSGLLAVALLLLAVGSGATYMYMKRDKASEQLSAQKPAAAPSKPQQIPVTAPNNIKTEQLPTAIVIVPAQQQKFSKAAEPPKQQKKSISLETSAVSKPDTKPVTKPDVTKEIKAASKANPAIPPSKPAAQASVKAVPTLRVNGIAFQDGNAADSVAIINGVPVSSGASIEGVKIDEIHKNRVKFSYNGEKFEIPLGQSNH